MYCEKKALPGHPAFPLCDKRGPASAPGFIQAASPGTAGKGPSSSPRFFPMRQKGPCFSAWFHPSGIPWDSGERPFQAIPLFSYATKGGLLRRLVSSKRHPLGRREKALPAHPAFFLCDKRGPASAPRFIQAHFRDDRKKVRGGRAFAHPRGSPDHYPCFQSAFALFPGPPDLRAIAHRSLPAVSHNGGLECLGVFQKLFFPVGLIGQIPDEGGRLGLLID